MRMYSLLLILFAALALGILITLLGDRYSRRAARRAAVWMPLILVAIVTLAGIAWAEIRLRRFAEAEKTDIRGLIARPVPFTTDHRYTPRGREYLYHGILLPASVTCIALVIIAFSAAAVLHMREPRRVILALWLSALAGILAVAVYSTSRFMEAIDLFI